MRLPTGLLLALSLHAVAATAADADDWLIARRGDVWKLVSKGPAGRVEKAAPNQEVLRMGENGVVLVVSMPAADGDGHVVCSEKERSDYRQTCSSAFLDCKADGGGLGMVLLGAAVGGSDGARGQRNKLSCSVNENAILGAAKTVGLIDRILPKPAPVTAAPPAPEPAPAPAPTPPLP